MKIQGIFSKGFFILFNLFMVFYFVRGYFYPVETNFWFVKYGVPILLMEFLILFGGMVIYAIKLGKKDKDNISKEDKIKFSIFLLFVIILAFLISRDANNYSLFGFFIFSTISKLILIKESNREEYSKIYGRMLIALLITLFLAFVLGMIWNFFPDNQQLLIDKLNTHGDTGEAFNDPKFILVFGVLYYLTISLFEILKKEDIEPELIEVRERKAKRK